MSHHPTSPSIVMDLTRFVVGSTLIISFVYATVKAWRKCALKSPLQYPPGPKGLPLIGNVFDLNVAKPWLSYEEWGKRYGDSPYSYFWTPLMTPARWHRLFKPARPGLYHHQRREDRSRTVRTSVVDLLRPSTHFHE